MASVNPLDKSERLVFTVFVAILVHAMLILGVTFRITFVQEKSPTLEVTLAAHSSEQAPDDADFIAQFNQQGSGQADDVSQPTTDQLAEYKSTKYREVREAKLLRAQELESVQQVVTTVGASELALRRHNRADPQAEKVVAGEDNATVTASDQLAAELARLDKLRKDYAKRPRIRRLTSVSAKSSLDAEYLFHWSQKIEFTGTRNFPKQAEIQGIVGSLRLLVAIDRHGNILSAEVIESSGHRVLDDAAIQIAHLAAPYPAFPKALAATTDRLEIIRTWYFDLEGVSTGSG